LGKIITGPVSQHVGGLFSIFVFSGIFYAVYAFFREQACTVVCPYGRLQSVLMDRNSMIVAYDHKRGEPRGKYNKKVTRELGDCIDCFQCVKVCPTGIDIRNGTQLECVGCTACIDACNAIMDKINQPLGLIRYASENGIENREPLRFTGRMKLYTVLLTGLLVILAVLLYTRKEIDATIMRTPGMLYQQRSDDSVSNLFNIKVANKTIYRVPLQLKLEGIDGRIEIIGEHNAISVKEEGQGAGTFFVVLPAKSIRTRKQPIRIALYNGNEKVDAIATNFLGPVNE